MSMNPKITLSVTLTFLLIFFSFHITYSQYLLNNLDNSSATASTLPPMPDFAAIKDIKQRKHAFFDYLTPHIRQQNSKIKALRRYIQKQNSNKPSTKIKQLAQQYRLPINDTDLKQSLLTNIDTIPPSLVLAQAAIESAWGTSRFATKGNNYFGQWCFTAGCGLVPTQRASGSHHEVRRFASPEDSIASYMLNLNSHPAYKQLRTNRLTLRNNNETANGCFLAEGLIKYSERKTIYVNSLKQLMRTNKLEEKQSEYCKSNLPAEENTANIRPPLVPQG